MKVKLEHVKLGIENWYITEVAPMNWKLYFALPLVKLYMNNIESQHNGILKMLLDEQGQIDVDELHKEYTQLIAKSGGMINVGPLQKVTIQDLDKLVGYIKQATPPTIA